MMKREINKREELNSRKTGDAHNHLLNYDSLFQSSALPPPPWQLPQFMY